MRAIDVQQRVWIGFGIISIMFLVGCAGQKKVLETEPPLSSTCKSQVLENAEIPGKTPDSTINEKAFRNRCYTQYGLSTEAKKIACSKNYELVSLINIQRPDYFFGKCYKADMLFYSKAGGFIVSEKPIVKYDTISAVGTQILAKIQMGTVTGGFQRDPGLTSEKGDKATANKVAFNVSARYFPVEYMGVEIETGYMSGEAVAPQTKAMDFLSEWSSNFGVSIIPWQRMTLKGRFQIAASGGVNYTKLVFADEYKDFVESNSTFIFYNTSANGFGWYSNLDLRLISNMGVLGEVGVRFLQEYPQFPSGTKAFSGSTVMLNFGVGYMF